MPHGCANSSRSVPKRSTACALMPAADSRSAQYPIDSAGTATLMDFAWLVPRLPIHPACRYGKLVRIVLASPTRFA